MRILLVRLSALGDVVMGLHVLSTLRARFGSAHIGWLVEDRFAPLLRGHPQLDALHVYERRRFRLPWNWWRIPAFLRRLRKERYDVALDLQGNLKSGVLAALSGARRRVGLGGALCREGNRLFVRERVAPPDPAEHPHRLDAYLRLVDEALGPGATAPGMLPAEAESPGAVILHAGTSAFGAYKRWPAESFAELGDRLGRRLDAEVRLTAGPGDDEQVEAVSGRMQDEPRIVRPEGLKGLANALQGARLFVAADTGPAHIAALLGVPTVVLFGPKDPRVMAPVGPAVRSVRTGARCSPCALRTCPDPVCMTGMTVDQVEREALELLEGSPSP